MKCKCPLCQTEFSPGEVEVLDICEDDQGRDLITFVCPKCMCEEEVQSLVWGR
jgi:hypothetical protein